MGHGSVAMSQYENITEEEKRVVQRVWRVISADLVEFGSLFFTCIFTDYPLMANYFPFSGPGDERFGLHTQKFMKQVSIWVANINQPLELGHNLHMLGTLHAKRNIEPEQFVRMRKSFVKSLGMKIGTRHFTEEHQKVFHKLLNIAMNEVIEAADKERVKRGIALF